MGRQSVPLLPSSIRWSGVALLATVVAYGSLTPAPPAPPDPGPLWDKKAHFAAYAALGLATAYATADLDRRSRASALAVVLAVAAFGLGVEIAQSFVPYRYFDLADAATNALGAALSLAWLPVERRFGYRYVFGGDATTPART